MRQNVFPLKSWIIFHCTYIPHLFIHWSHFRFFFFLHSSANAFALPSKYTQGRPDWCVSVGNASSHKARGHWFDSQSGPTRGLQAWSEVWGACESQPTDVSLTCWYFSPSLMHSASAALASWPLPEHTSLLLLQGLCTCNSLGRSCLSPDICTTHSLTSFKRHSLRMSVPDHSVQISGPRPSPPSQFCSPVWCPCTSASHLPAEGEQAV